jgi:hypothetical protein
MDSSHRIVLPVRMRPQLRYDLLHLFPFPQGAGMAAQDGEYYELHGQFSNPRFPA